LSVNQSGGALVEDDKTKDANVANTIKNANVVTEEAEVDAITEEAKNANVVTEEAKVDAITEEAKNADVVTEEAEVDAITEMAEAKEDNAKKVEQYNVIKNEFDKIKSQIVSQQSETYIHSLNKNLNAANDFDAKMSILDASLSEVSDNSIKNQILEIQIKELVAQINAKKQMISHITTGDSIVGVANYEFANFETLNLAEFVASSTDKYNASLESFNVQLMYMRVLCFYLNFMIEQIKKISDEDSELQYKKSALPSFQKNINIINWLSMFNVNDAKSIQIGLNHPNHLIQALYKIMSTNVSIFTPMNLFIDPHFMKIYKYIFYACDISKITGAIDADLDEILSVPSDTYFDKNNKRVFDIYMHQTNSLQSTDSHQNMLKSFTVMKEKGVTSIKDALNKDEIDKYLSNIKNVIQTHEKDAEFKTYQRLLTRYFFLNDRYSLPSVKKRLGNDEFYMVFVPETADQTSDIQIVLDEAHNELFWNVPNPSKSTYGYLYKTSESIVKNVDIQLREHGYNVIPDKFLMRVYSVMSLYLANVLAFKSNSIMTDTVKTCIFEHILKISILVDKDQSVDFDSEINYIYNSLRNYAQAREALVTRIKNVLNFGVTKQVGGRNYDKDFNSFAKEYSNRNLTKLKEFYNKDIKQYNLEKVIIKHANPNKLDTFVPKYYIYKVLSDILRTKEVDGFINEFNIDATAQNGKDVPHFESLFRVIRHNIKVYDTNIVKELLLFPKPEVKDIVENGQLYILPYLYYANENDWAISEYINTETRSLQPQTKSGGKARKQQRGGVLDELKDKIHASWKTSNKNYEVFTKSVLNMLIEDIKTKYDIDFEGIKSLPTIALLSDLQNIVLTKKQSKIKISDDLVKAFSKVIPIEDTLEILYNGYKINYDVFNHESVKLFGNNYILFHIFFKNKNEQGFTKILERVHAEVDTMIDVLSQSKHSEFIANLQRELQQFTNSPSQVKWFSDILKDASKYYDFYEDDEFKKDVQSKVNEYLANPDIKKYCDVLKLFVPLSKYNAFVNSLGVYNQDSRDTVSQSGGGFFSNMKNKITNALTNMTKEEQILFSSNSKVRDIVKRHATQVSNSKASSDILLIDKKYPFDLDGGSMNKLFVNLAGKNNDMVAMVGNDNNIVSYFANLNNDIEKNINQYIYARQSQETNEKPQNVTSKNMEGETRSSEPSESTDDNISCEANGTCHKVSLDKINIDNLGSKLGNMPPLLKKELQAQPYDVQGQQYVSQQQMYAQPYGVQQQQQVLGVPVMDNKRDVNYGIAPMTSSSVSALQTINTMEAYQKKQDMKKVERINDNIAFIEDFIKFMEDKGKAWMEDIESVTTRERFQSIVQKAPLLAESSTSDEDRRAIIGLIKQHYMQFPKNISNRARVYFDFVKNFYVKDARRKVQEILVFIEDYQDKPVKPQNYEELVGKFEAVTQTFSKINDNLYRSLGNALAKYASPSLTDNLDPDLKVKIVSYIDEADETLNKYRNKLKSFYKLNYSMADLVLDTQFIVLYLIKAVRIAFTYIALFLTTKVFSPIYEEQVYDKKENPPSLSMFLLIYIGFDLAFNVFIMVVLFLLKFLFKTDDNAFPIDKFLFYKYMTDYAISMIFVFVIAVLVASIIQSKKYFKYKYEGLRAVRAFQDVVFYIASVIFIFPYFWIF
jgi:hypothetical protein